MTRCIGGPSDGVEIDAARYPDEFVNVRDPIPPGPWLDRRIWSERFQQWLAPKLTTKYRRVERDGEAVLVPCEPIETVPLPGEAYGRSPAMEALAGNRQLAATDSPTLVRASAAHVRLLQEIGVR